MTNNLQERFVFLAASYPAREFKASADSQEIAGAVKALLATVFHAHGKIVFGGHPSISPLVLMMAREFGRMARVHIYQSEVFDGSLSEATLRLRDEGYGQIISTPVDFSERTLPAPTPDSRNFPNSLKIMRESMLSQTTTNPAGAVFIGGDTGLFEEQRLFASRIRGAPMYAVGAPGGAARMISESMAKENPTELATKLKTSRNYLSLMREVVADIEGNLGIGVAAGGF
jgi:hypothetical protein